MNRVNAWVPVALWVAVILVAANDFFSGEHSQEWLEVMFGAGVPDVLNFVVRKLAHVVEYGILGALTWRADRRAAVVLLVAAAVAVTDETMQSFSASRTGSVWDILFDLGGATLALLLLTRVGRERMLRQEES